MIRWTARVDVGLRVLAAVIAAAAVASIPRPEHLTHGVGPFPLTVNLVDMDSDAIEGEVAVRCWHAQDRDHPWHVVTGTTTGGTWQATLDGCAAVEIAGVSPGHLPARERQGWPGEVYLRLGNAPEDAHPEVRIQGVHGRLRPGARLILEHRDTPRPSGRWQIDLPTDEHVDAWRGLDLDGDEPIASMVEVLEDDVDPLDSAVPDESGDTGDIEWARTVSTGWNLLADRPAISRRDADIWLERTYADDTLETPRIVAHTFVGVLRDPQSAEQPALAWQQIGTLPDRLLPLSGSLAHYQALWVRCHDESTWALVVPLPAAPPVRRCLDGSDGCWSWTVDFQVLLQRDGSMNVGTALPISAVDALPVPDESLLHAELALFPRDPR